MQPADSMPNKPGKRHFEGSSSGIPGQPRSIPVVISLMYGSMTEPSSATTGRAAMQTKTGSRSLSLERIRVALPLSAESRSPHTSASQSADSACRRRCPLGATTCRCCGWHRVAPPILLAKSAPASSPNDIGLPQSARNRCWRTERRFGRSLSAQPAPRAQQLLVS